MRANTRGNSIPGTLVALSDDLKLLSMVSKLMKYIKHTYEFICDCKICRYWLVVRCEVWLGGCIQRNLLVVPPHRCLSTQAHTQSFSFSQLILRKKKKKAFKYYNMSFSFESRVTLWALSTLNRNLFKKKKCVKQIVPKVWASAKEACRHC